MRRLGLAVVVVFSVVLALTLAEVVLRAALRRALTTTTRTHRSMTSDPVLHHRTRLLSVGVLPPCRK